MGYMACDVGTVLQQVVKILNIFAGGTTLFRFVVLHTDSKLRTGRIVMSTIAVVHDATAKAVEFVTACSL